jgi:DNA repair exonuclease SbcCD ATPase subunit
MTIQGEQTETVPAAPPLGSDGDTGNGFLVGTESPQPRNAADWNEALNDTMAGSHQQSPPVQLIDNEQSQQQQQPNGRIFTEDDVERIRREEKDKLYGRVENLSQQLETLQKEREEAERLRQEELQREQERLRQEEESAMDLRELLTKKETEWQERFSRIEQEREQDRALLETERRFQQLEQYRQDRLSQEAEYIMPELRDLVSGSSEDEIEAAISAMKDKTAGIMAQVQQSQAAFQQNQRMAAPTAPPVGPMEQQTTYETLTPEDIRSMDMETYRRHRDQLLNAARPR